MTLDEKTLELFDNYLDSALSERERQDFEDQLKKDSELHELYKAYQQSVDLIKEEGLRQELEQIVTQNEGRSHSVKLRPTLPYAVAASIAGLLLLGYLFWPGRDNPTELFTAYYEPYPNIYQTRTAETSNLASALVAYNSGNYEQALLSLNDLIEQNDGVHFYRSMCYLSLNQPEEALLSFNNLSKTTIFNEQVQWYSALAYLLKSMPDSALILLRKIEPGQYAYPASQEIISALE